MADPSPDEPRPQAARHAVGADLSTLSRDEIDAAIAALEAEIGRLRAARAAKDESRRAAESFFAP